MIILNRVLWLFQMNRFLLNNKTLYKNKALKKTQKLLRNNKKELIECRD